MLNTLKDLKPDEAVQVIAGATQSFLPDPGITDPAAEDAGLQALHKSVLTEVRGRLGISEAEESPEAKTRLLESLTNEMTALILGDADIPAIKERLGQRGDLKPDLYRIEFQKDFNDAEGKRGIRRNHVEEALRQPDDVQHLFGDHAPDKEREDLSLYLRRHGEPGPDEFFLLVQTKRRGYTQTVHFAWRIYLSDIDLSQIREPLDVLKAFVAEFGVLFRVGDSEVQSKFLLDENFPISNQDSSRPISFENPDKKLMFFSVVHRRKNDSTVHFAIAYIIDMNKYLASLRKHGVQVEHSGTHA